MNSYFFILWDVSAGVENLPCEASFGYLGEAYHYFQVASSLHVKTQ